MKDQGILIIALLLGTSAFAQQPKDKGGFIPYDNAFYGEIKKGIRDYETQDRNSPRTFKMDYTGKDIPKSVDEFKTVWCNDPLSQGRTGTCWCFASSSFFESEIHRITGKEVKLSELYTVYWEYVEKAREYVKTRGESFFGEGSETNAVPRMMAQYGVVPQEAYNGMQSGQKYHDHKGLYREMKHYLKTIKEQGAWNEEVVLAIVKNILDHYIGEPPATFKWNGSVYTPQAFFEKVTKLKTDEYVNFMSLKEKPWWENAEYKVPDNWWRSDDYYNVPADDFMEAIKSALSEGYSLAIGGDVSESGYSSQHDAAMVPSYDIPGEYIDDNARQFRFSNKSTTDDHAIHLVGWKEHNGDTWFLVKDSGSGAQNGKNRGYYFYHEDYVKLKIMTFTVHKDGVKNTLKKMKEVGMR